MDATLTCDFRVIACLFNLLNRLESNDRTRRAGFECWIACCRKGAVRVVAAALVSLVWAGQGLFGVIPLSNLIWRVKYGGQITIAGNRFGKIGD